MSQLMPVPLTVSCFSKIQIGFTFLVPTHLGSHGQTAIKRACVCVFCQTDYLNVHWTNLHSICRIGRTFAVDERSKVIFFDSSRNFAMDSNVVGNLPCSLRDIH